jgi:MFS transporter, PPP family, 3-phenylpropionic acid transporter
MARLLDTAVSWFLLLYAAIYAAYGVQSPYLPALLESRGLGPGEIGAILAAALAIRIPSGPVAGWIADRLGAPKAVLSGCAAAAAAFALGYWGGRSFSALLAVAVLQAAVLAPLAPLSDSLTLAAALPGRTGVRRSGFDYGLVRGAGSAAFIIGTLLAGQAARHLGIGVIVWLNAILLAGTAMSATLVPPLPLGRVQKTNSRDEKARGAIGGLLRLRIFRRVMLVAALIIGSHALHDSFAVIRWRAAGLDSGMIGLLWSESVAAEVLVFLLIGRRALDRLGSARAAALAAACGVVRWTVMAQTTWVPALAVIQPLHGITFALLHLSCMRLMAQSVPAQLAATALALYGTVAMGLASALLTLAAGPLYGRFGAGGFWLMAGLCVLALPLALGLKRQSGLAPP